MQEIARQNVPDGHDVLVIVPSSSTVYMSHDIPYPFRQNTDFLYLTGFQEPNSILVMQAATGVGGKDSSCIDQAVSTLFVPKKDPVRELWDGPRSGTDGAMKMTGVDQAFDMERFDRYMEEYYRKARYPLAMWYDRRKPAHPEFHAQHIVRLLEEGKNKFVESPRRLVQRLRLVKSAAEIELMRRSCEIASEAFIEVFKFSTPHVQYDIHCALSNLFRTQIGLFVNIKFIL